MLQILCKTPAAIFKIQIPADTKSKFNNVKWMECKDNNKQEAQDAYWLKEQGKKKKGKNSVCEPSLYFGSDSCCMFVDGLVFGDHPDMVKKKQAQESQPSLNRNPNKSRVSLTSQA